MQGRIKLITFGIALLTCSALLAQDNTDTAVTIKIIPAVKEQPGVTVTGVIKDAATGKPLSAINVSVPEFSAALTDDNGNFSIKVPGYNATLFISAEGFQSKEIPLRGSKNVTAVLYEEAYNSIYDNVTLPFGVRSQNQTVNAIGSVNTGGAWNRPLESPDSYLQGKVAGLHPVMRSGTPNLGAYLMLRGYTSLYATNDSG